MKKLFRFLLDSKDEVKKISWPDKEEVSRLTFITLVTLIIVSVFLWVVDSVIYQIIKLVIQ